ncbi:MAG TPA: hypothetical protein VK153_02830 [Candidatus Paceibacterota bacterium]|nr:hypothetical protein [Candidatus Paceibacterota bacterium]
MKNIAKTMLLILAGLVFFFNANAQSLVGYTWQLQNPQKFSQSIMLSFNSQNEVVFTSGDLQSLILPVSYSGTYELYGDILEVKLGNEVARAKILWMNQDRMVLVNKQGRSVYAKCGSSEDQFYSNYLNITSGYSGGGYNNYNNYNNGGSYSNSNSSNTVCYTCYGSGSCKVCGGTGRYSMYGQSGTCSACGGSGKCWHCHGSGKQ